MTVYARLRRPKLIVEFFKKFLRCFFPGSAFIRKLPFLIFEALYPEIAPGVTAGDPRDR
jgi:hypothetical protein